MDKAEVRARFDKEVDAPDKELLWELLVDKGDVDDACDGPGGWDEFKEQAEKGADWQWRLLGRNKPPGRESRYHSPYPLIEVEITAHEAEHAATLAPYLAKRAALLPEVRGFREEKLGGGTLDYTQVAGFLRGEFRHLPLGIRDVLEWAVEQIPSNIEADGSEVLKDLVGGCTNRSPRSFSSHWSQNLRRVSKYESTITHYTPYESTIMHYTPSGPFLHGLMHLIRDGAGNTLDALGRSLVAHYPWPLRDAAWFVITGEAPEVETLNIEDNLARGTCTITLVPWISEETLRRAYRGLHENDNRPLSSKVLSAFRFVDEHTDPGQTPKWAQLTRLWNARNPEPGQTFWDGSALKRAYERAEKRLASPRAN